MCVKGSREASGARLRESKGRVIGKVRKAHGLRAEGFGLAVNEVGVIEGVTLPEATNSNNVTSVHAWTIARTKGEQASLFGGRCSNLVGGLDSGSGSPVGNTWSGSGYTLEVEPLGFIEVWMRGLRERNQR